MDLFGQHLPPESEHVNASDQRLEKYEISAITKGKARHIDDIPSFS